MRSLPPMVWILIFFVVGAVGTFLYAKSGPDLPPPSTSVWEHVDQVRQEIQFRNENINVGAKVERNQKPYVISIERLENLDKDGEQARYVLRFQTDGSIGKRSSWVKGGFSVGLIDTQPNDVVGALQIIAMRKFKKKEVF